MGSHLIPLTTFYFNLIMVSSVISSITCFEVKPYPLTNLTTLQLVQIIARHGDRAPIRPYPNDLYRNASVYSINGWGELTEIGAKQVYELGSYLRKRYDGFLPRKYRKRDFLMLSSDIDRAIMSAETNLAGLYELGPIPRSRDIFTEWQPVPIHTIPESEDNFINNKANCPRFNSLYQQFLNSEEFASFLTENKDFIEFIIVKSGLEAIRTDFNEMFQVQDALRCQRLHNLTLPAWVNKTVIEKLEDMKALSFTWKVRTIEMKRLKVGPLFERLVEGMRAKVEASNLIVGDDSDNNDDTPPYQDPIIHRRMYVYSGHDSTITGLLEALNLFNPPHIPPYASAIIIELHKHPGSGEFFVELAYKNNTAEAPFRFDPLSFCGAERSCSFQNFSTIAHKFVLSDWKRECEQEISSAPLLNGAKSSSASVTTFPKTLMKTDPYIFYDDPRYSVLHPETNNSSSNMIVIHPLGIGAPGLPGFLLTVLAMTSFLASTILLSTFLRQRTKPPDLPVCITTTYQQLN